MAGPESRPPTKIEQLRSREENLLRRAGRRMENYYGMDERLNQDQSLKNTARIGRAKNRISTWALRIKGELDSVKSQLQSVEQARNYLREVEEAEGLVEKIKEYAGHLPPELVQRHVGELEDLKRRPENDSELRQGIEWVREEEEMLRAQREEEALAEAEEAEKKRKEEEAERRAREGRQSVILNVGDQTAALVEGENPVFYEYDDVFPAFLLLARNPEEEVEGQALLKAQEKAKNPPLPLSKVIDEIRSLFPVPLRTKVLERRATNPRDPNPKFVLHSDVEIRERKSRGGRRSSSNSSKNP